ncbi:carbohydrate kinase [Opitutaceae bacterium TAV5]|nr:carbohydrate kinase [Opitutaceae bacterium TAV5]
MPTTITDILGIGYCGWDMLCVVPRIPVDDKVEIREYTAQGGGPAATAIVAAARLGLRTAFMGVTGDDVEGQRIRDEFAHEKVDTRTLVRRGGVRSAVGFSWIDAGSGRRSIAWSHGTAAPLEPNEIDEGLIGSARALHCDGHQTRATIRAAEIARERGIPVLLDAGTLVNGIEKLMRLCTVIIASEIFAKKFTGLDDPKEAIRKLHAIAPVWTGITLGPGGCIGFDGTRLHRVPAYPVAVVDTTGAGDVFHGAFAACYVRQLTAHPDKTPDMEQCLRFATVAASLKCRALGGRTGIPSLEEAHHALDAWQPADTEQSAA